MVQTSACRIDCFYIYFMTCLLAEIVLICFNMILIIKLEFGLDSIKYAVTLFRLNQIFAIIARCTKVMRRSQFYSLWCNKNLKHSVDVWSFPGNIFYLLLWGYLAIGSDGNCRVIDLRSAAIIGRYLYSSHSRINK